MESILFYYFLSCIIQIVHIIAFKIISNHKEKIYWKYTPLVLITSFFTTLVNYINMNLVNSILSIIYIFTLYYLIFRKSLKQTIYYGFVIWITGMILDILLMFKNTLWLTNLSNTIIRTIDTFIMAILIFSIVNLKVLKKSLNKLYEKIQKLNFSYFKLIFIVIIIILLTHILLKNTIQHSLDNEFALFAIVVIALIYLYINNEYTIFSIRQTNKHLIKDNEFYLGIINEYRILKHNIIHQLNGVKSVSNKEATELIDDLIKKYNKKFQTTSNINKMPLGINGVTYEKIYNFNNPKIKLGIENKIETNIFDNLTPRSYNLLCEALGILLDNALEATSKSKEKIVMIDMDETEFVYSVKIINTFSTDLDIEKLGTINYSTKDTGNGIGLFSLFGRKKLKIKTSIINNLFQNEILIEKKQK